MDQMIFKKIMKSLEDKKYKKNNKIDLMKMNVFKSIFKDIF